MNYANLDNLTSLVPADHPPTETAVANTQLPLFKPKRTGGRPKLANPKVAIKMRLDPDVMHFFRSAGAGWQTRINAALREYVELASRTR